MAHKLAVAASLTSVLALSVPTLLLSVPVKAASFDCGKARTSTEIAICENASLGKLDEQIAELYSSLHSALVSSERAKMVEEQRRFLKERNSCGSSASCLQESYESRKADLCNRASIKGLPVAGPVCLLATPTMSADTNTLVARYPWLVKPQTELSFTECKNAKRHDSNYWWSGGKCHMKFIRYAAGVVTEDAPAAEDPSSILKKGELLTAITQYRPSEGLYCEKGGYCYPSKNVRLLGSVRRGPYDTEYKSGDESDLWEGVSSSCELLLKDRSAIVAANAEQLLEGCH